jgi:putative transposase
MAANSWMTCVSSWAGGWRLAVVKRSDTQPRSTFAVQPHRWIVERTFSWWGGLRRLSRDYAYQVAANEALIYAGMSHVVLRRLIRSPATDARSGPAG